MHQIHNQLFLETVITHTQGDKNNSVRKRPPVSPGVPLSLKQKLQIMHEVLVTIQKQNVKLISTMKEML